jgi:formylglycine-generating enzyme required for sulfatase activity
VGVSWNAAQAYVRWARERTGRNYALPTELEWTRAAGERGLNREYPFGHVFMPKWVSSNWSRRIARIEPVMRYPIDESPLGMYDASGSAMEWLDAPYGDRPGARWLAGGTWGHSDPALFRIPGGWGASPDAAAGVYGFRMVWRP